MVRCNSGRIWELDLVRGTALILMIYYHLIYDLDYICNLPVNSGSFLNSLAGKTSAVLFILTAGVCSRLSRNNIKRGLKVFAAAILVTAASYLFDPGMPILFGILHFLALSIILSAALKNAGKYYLLAAGTVFIIAGYFIRLVNVKGNYLLIFGIINSTFSSGDYYPLIPWFGIFLYGMALGKELYSRKQSLFGIHGKYDIVVAAGRHTLLIYLVHQPLILLVLKMLKMY